jgi:hypothetical protein
VLGNARTGGEEQAAAAARDAALQPALRELSHLSSHEAAVKVKVNTVQRMRVRIGLRLRPPAPSGGQLPGKRTHRERGVARPGVQSSSQVVVRREPSRFAGIANAGRSTRADTPHVQSRAVDMREGRIFLSVALAISCGITLQSTAFSQEYRGTWEQQRACTPDVWRLCGAQIPDVDRIVACLRQNTPQLSERCRAVFAQGNAPSRGDGDYGQRRYGRDGPQRYDRDYGSRPYDRDYEPRPYYGPRRYYGPRPYEDDEE